ncbi:MAG: hypothetical protein HC889_15420 [Synechococcaceae cyanobacterium SM1_2_3]|nr:hypothetical protein [Synechococcaceae cyanobacterium SM1_2_3]
MPIKAENKGRYPKNWKQIRAAILERAGHRCEECGIPNHVWRHNRIGLWTTGINRVACWRALGVSVTRIVLTIAHLDHTPENCDPANLRALCQRCHLAYDAQHHARNAARTRYNRREQAGQQRLELSSGPRVLSSSVHI